MLPKAPANITKGSSLKVILDKDAINCLSQNISTVYPEFQAKAFKSYCLRGITTFELLDRGRFLADALYAFLPKPYSKALSILLDTLTPPLTTTEGFGLQVFYYLPYSFFVSKYGLDPKFNNGRDPFELSMKAQYEITKRFTSEYSIRNFLIHQQKRTLKRLKSWTEDPSPHVRRLCSEGTRPRLPWAIRIPAFIMDPTPSLSILEKLKDDPELYVRRSVANHVADIAKDHPKVAYKICKDWIKSASDERKWVIRHALRYPAKKNDLIALSIRKKASWKAT